MTITYKDSRPTTATLSTEEEPQVQKYMNMVRRELDKIEKELVSLEDDLAPILLPKSVEDDSTKSEMVEEVVVPLAGEMRLLRSMAFGIHYNIQSIRNRLEV